MELLENKDVWLDQPSGDERSHSLMLSLADLDPVSLYFCGQLVVALNYYD